MYNILLEFRIPIRLVRLIKMCLNKTCSRVWVGKRVADIFPIRNGLKRGGLSPLLDNFALEYAIRRIHVNQDGLKFNGTHQLLVYAEWRKLHNEELNGLYSSPNIVWVKKIKKK